MIIRFASRAISTAAFLLSGASAMAHPGHGLLDRGATHLLASPYHIAVLSLMGAGCWIAARVLRRHARSKRFLHWSGSAALVAAVVLWAVGA
ncbi:MAG: hypothetical protein QOF48_1758 [Verrucomicrobiota bacterium]|jgi:uncharacterized membrane protein